MSLNQLRDFLRQEHLLMSLIRCGHWLSLRSRLINWSCLSSSQSKEVSACNSLLSNVCTSYGSRLFISRCVEVILSYAKAKTWIMRLLREDIA